MENIPTLLASASENYLFFQAGSKNPRNILQVIFKNFWSKFLITIIITHATNGKLFQPVWPHEMRAHLPHKYLFFSLLRIPDPSVFFLMTDRNTKKNVCVGIPPPPYWAPKMTWCVINVRCDVRLEPEDVPNSPRRRLRDAHLLLESGLSLHSSNSQYSGRTSTWALRGPTT